MKKRSVVIPFAYFITFTTYGTWLHGDHRGSTDKHHNQYGEKKLQPMELLCDFMRKEKNNQIFFLKQKERIVVMNAIISVCKHYDWHLHAIHVRSNHIHLIVKSDELPEKVMNIFKAYASRALNKFLNIKKTKKYWSRHGSTRYIWSDKFLFSVMNYVIEEQGIKMACYYDAWYEKSKYLE